MCLDGRANRGLRKEMIMTAEEKIVPTVPAADKSDKHPDKRKALGRGLDSLLPSSLPGRAGPAIAGEPAGPQPGIIGDLHAQATRPRVGESVVEVALDHIDANP